MTINSLPACPSCGLNDHSYKVSLLYIAASARLSHKEDESHLPDAPHQEDAAQNEQLDAVLADLLSKGGHHGPKSLLQQIVKYFSPPTGKKATTRIIHPDWMVVFGCAVGLIFSYRMAALQSGSLPVIISILAIGLLAYLISRRPVLNRYYCRIGEEKDAASQLELATDRWMRLYYCSRDSFVFNPDQQLFVPVEQLNDLLFDRKDKTSLPNIRRIE